jgi:predicted PhzF superfamily epimerase YddE/YHI9
MRRMRPMPDTAVLLAGSAFVDAGDPTGELGNPFAVVLGGDVAGWDTARRSALAGRTGTPETVFIDAVNPAPGDDGWSSIEVAVTVLTPTGERLGACAHGIMGAVRAMAETVSSGGGPHRFEITTSTGVRTRALLHPDGAVDLGFQSLEARYVAGCGPAVDEVFGVAGLATGSLPILSVGSPKLTVEVPGATFDMLRARLDRLDYDRLMSLQRDVGVNGIHVYNRDPATGLPARAIQVNAYLGRALVVDRATGVSHAAQVGGDSAVEPGQRLRIAQYTQAGCSAVIAVTKGRRGQVTVGGATILGDPRIL